MGYLLRITPPTLGFSSSQPYIAVTSSPSPKSQNVAVPLSELPGLSLENCTNLQASGITTIRQLYAQTKAPQQRQQLAAQLKIHEQHVNKWAALAELSLIPKVGTKNCGLLLHAGISSTAQLAQIPAERLHKQLLRLHVATLRQNTLCPSVAIVTQWILQARQMINRR